MLEKWQSSLRAFRSSFCAPSAPNTSKSRKRLRSWMRAKMRQWHRHRELPLQLQAGVDPNSAAANTTEHGIARPSPSLSLARTSSSIGIDAILLQDYLNVYLGDQDRPIDSQLSHTQETETATQKTQSQQYRAYHPDYSPSKTHTVAVSARNRDSYHTRHPASASRHFRFQDGTKRNTLRTCKCPRWRNGHRSLPSWFSKGFRPSPPTPLSSPDPDGGAQIALPIKEVDSLTQSFKAMSLKRFIDGILGTHFHVDRRTSSFSCAHAANPNSAYDGTGSTTTATYHHPREVFHAVKGVNAAGFKAIEHLSYHSPGRQGHGPPARMSVEV